MARSIAWRSGSGFRPSESTDMAIRQEHAQLREQYASDTGLRMRQMAVELLAIDNAKVRNAANLYPHLLQQEKASQLAGFNGISNLCRQMQDSLNRAQEGGLPQLRATARTLLGVCRAIEFHAQNVEKSVLRVDGGAECGRRRGVARSETMLYAAILPTSALDSCCVAETD
jgi:hypothetical protein